PYDCNGSSPVPRYRQYPCELASGDPRGNRTHNLL
ncbi:uncharacterized protein METZ01_LOCUS475980, partial [marine metagenome]